VNVDGLQGQRIDQARTRRGMGRETSLRLTGSRENDEDDKARGSSLRGKQQREPIRELESAGRKKLANGHGSRETVHKEGELSCHTEPPPAHTPHGTNPLHLISSEDIFYPGSLEVLPNPLKEAETEARGSIIQIIKLPASLQDTDESGGGRQESIEEPLRKKYPENTRGKQPTFLLSAS